LNMNEKPVQTLKVLFFYQSSTKNAKYNLTILLKNFRII